MQGMSRFRNGQRGILRSLMKFWMAGLLLSLSALTGAPTSAPSDWKMLSDRQGRFDVMLPSKAEHLQNSLQLEGNQKLHYDLFVAAKDPKTVFMILAAQYPTAIPENERTLSLEYFLNGIIGQNGQNQLISADLVPMEGHQALDFHMISKGTHLRGRALITGFTLYVLAMEVHAQEINEELFAQFIASFHLRSSAT